jgi:hypothetical protein
MYLQRAGLVSSTLLLLCAFGGNLLDDGRCTDGVGSTATVETSGSLKSAGFAAIEKLATPYGILPQLFAAVSTRFFGHLLLYHRTAPFSF